MDEQLSPQTDTEQPDFKPEVGDIVIYQIGPFDSETVKFNYPPELPAVVVRVWSDICVNLKILTDGPDDAWKTSVMKGEGLGEWRPKENRTMVELSPWVDELEATISEWIDKKLKGFFG
jgi:hypothetical protein